MLCIQVSLSFSHGKGSSILYYIGEQTEALSESVVKLHRIALSSTNQVSRKYIYLQDEYGHINLG